MILPFTCDNGRLLARSGNPDTAFDTRLLKQALDGGTLGWWSAGWATAIATGVGAAGTVGTLTAALVGLGRERKRRREDESAAIDRAARSHAEGVAAWVAQGAPLAGLAPMGGPETVIALQNDSRQPAYSAIATVVFVQGNGPRTAEDAGPHHPFMKAISVIPPGRSHITIKESWAGMFRRPAVDLAFVDQRGQSWMRRSNGALEQLPNEPAVYLGLPGPLDTVFPTAG